MTNGEINTIGIGAIEAVPRRILLVHNSTPQGGNEQESSAHLKAMMPLHYLGYRVDLLDIHRFGLPEITLADRYAGVVALFEANEPEQQEELERFLTRVVDENVPLTFLNRLGVPVISPLGLRLGLAPTGRALREPVRVSYQASTGVGEELAVQPTTKTIPVLAPKGSTPLLTMTDAAQQSFDVAAVTPWGGYAMAPYTYVSIADKAERWVIDPIKFMEQTIVRNQFQPMPDVTTENGRRLLLIHIDGDGFASRAEIPGAPFAAEVMYKDFIARYKVPHTVSVIEGETGPKGLYPHLSPTLERIARKIFKLDHVELASHSYSHPFFWGNVVANAEKGVQSSHSEKLQHLPIEGYNFDLSRDVRGSIDYINSRLAPPGKTADVFLWTGDCVPPAKALRETYEAGLLNMNAGDTTTTLANQSLTLVAPMSIRKDGWLQVLAPNQNENVYTNDWTGPFYGFDRVIETFELTNAPRRIKPINIYYHTYSASKSSAISALHRVYRYALKQPVNPVYSSDYIRKVHDFETFATAREVGDKSGREVWRLAGGGHLRTVRVPDAMSDRINWKASRGIAGRKTGIDGTYLHLSNASARVVFEKSEQALEPHVVAANGRINDFKYRERGFSFQFSSHVTGRLTLAHAPGCKVRASRKRLKVRSVSALPGGNANRLKVYDYRTRVSQTGSTLDVTVDC